MISAERLTRAVGRRLAAVSDASIAVEKGEAVALVGAAGAGAATLLALLATMLRPTFGTLHIGGIDAVRDPIAARRRICWPVLPGNLTGTVGDYLRFLARMRDVDEARVHDVLDRVALNDSQPVRRLTRLERSDLAAATALVAGADVVLVGDPLDGDAGAARLWRAVLRDLRDAGTTILFSARPAAELPRWCDRVVRLENGRVTDEVRARRFVPDTKWQVIRA